jgi:serine/threonine-protein phosphatase PGAM5
VSLGEQQAELVAARLQSLPANMTSLHSSTMTRARQTAEIIGRAFPDLTIEMSRDLRECTPPTWREDIMAEHAAGEADSCSRQLERAFARYFRPAADREAHDILVCHGNVIRYFVCRALGVEPRAWLGMTIANCSLTIIRVQPDGAMKMVSFSDVGHLPCDLQTYPGQTAVDRLRMPD